MSDRDLALVRLQNQGITHPIEDDPVAVVRRLGAVQAQDFAAGKWAIGLRTVDATDAQVEEAFNQGRILRTHVLRPTWHFVTPEDIRWMLELTAPRVNAIEASQYRRLGLDDNLFRRSQTIMEEALRSERFLARSALLQVLRQAGISGSNLVLINLLMRAELDGLIRSGPRIGKEFSFALLDQRAPESRRLVREEALAELALRYVTSRGPATVRDFTWWSGLTVRDAKAGIASVKDRLESITVDGTEYWLDSNATPVSDARGRLHLLPNFDEYVVGYRDRGAYLHPTFKLEVLSRSNPLFNHIVVSAGRITGTWARNVKRQSVEIAVNAGSGTSPPASEVLAAAVERYEQFIGLPVHLV